MRAIIITLVCVQMVTMGALVGCRSTEPAPAPLPLPAEPHAPGQALPPIPIEYYEKIN